MPIGDARTGVVSKIKGYNRRGGMWLPKQHERYAKVAMTDKFMTSQLCVYLYFPIVHGRTSENKTVLGTARCLNLECEVLRQGRACNNMDVIVTVCNCYCSDILTTKYVLIYVSICVSLGSSTICIHLLYPAFVYNISIIILHIK